MIKELRERGTTRELSVLVTAVIKHPACPPVLSDGIRNLFSENAEYVEYYESPEIVELFLLAMPNGGRDGSRR